MRTLTRFVVASMLAFSALVAGPTGCSDDEGSGTSGHRIALDVKIEASQKATPFTTATGWNVTLSKALISTGAFYFYDGETLFASRAPSWSFVKSALAHPGHYVPGNAKGEMLTASSADLLVGGMLGNGNGVSGFARSATFTFASPATGAVAAELGANAILLEGTAVKGVETRTFRAELGPNDVKDAKGVMQIEGCPFTPADMQVDGVVTIRVKLETWFDQVAFDDVPPSTDGKPVLLGDGLTRNQLVRGTKVGLAYQFSYAPR